ncbi:MAG: Crp/Fnr family transcriptional regulator [Anaerolineae bacterium]|nr:Crp/Fnr family transcriptional regulator [Anaerolineae bacterium]
MTAYSTSLAQTRAIHHNQKLGKILSQVPYFSGLDSAAMRCVISASIRQVYRAGQIVFMEGEPCIGLYVVEKGWLRAVKTSGSGREQVIRFVGPGDAFNEVGVLTGGVNVVMVEALENASVVIVQREILLSLVDHCPTLAKSIIENLASRVLYAMNLVTELSLHPVESRLARFLLEQAAGQDTISRKSWATQAAIAARIGTVPVVINRAFRGLIECKLIDLERNQIHILDRAELERRAFSGE